MSEINNTNEITREELMLLNKKRELLLAEMEELLQQERRENEVLREYANAQIEAMCRRIKQMLDGKGFCKCELCLFVCEEEDSPICANCTELGGSEYSFRLIYDSYFKGGATNES